MIPLEIIECAGEEWSLLHIKVEFDIKRLTLFNMMNSKDWLENYSQDIVGARLNKPR